MIGTILGLGILPVALATSPAGADTPATRAVAVSITMASVAMAGLWVGRGWPSKRRSSVMVTVTVLCIAGACLIVEPLPGLTSCTVFAAIGGYIAFFHSSRFMMYNLAVAFTTAAVLAVRVATQDWVLALAMLVIVVIANISVPVTTQALIQALGIDALHSHTDPLTGLYNRRAFYRQVTQMLESHRAGDRFLVIVMIDLDKFKQLNDTAGHAVGDRALVTVARTLRDRTRRTAAVGRAGGEEFLVADRLSSPDATPLAERLRAALDGCGSRISASIGTVTIPMHQGWPENTHEVIDHLIAVADGAMYEAKRAGGNQCRHRAISDAGTWREKI